MSAKRMGSNPRFYTNYIPSDEEIKEIQLDIASRSEELARLDARIRELSTERDEIQAYIDSQKALISHPRRLPADIVRDVFIACLPTRRNAVMSAQEAPLLLCRICSAWRTIALSTPRLWASMHVPFHFILAKEPRTLAVAQWLQRSAACPISFSVYEGWADPIEGVSRSAGRDAVIRSLCAVSDRWRHVEFDGMVSEVPHELSDITSASLLDSFKFSGWTSILDRLTFYQVPSLRTVTLHLEGAEPVTEFLLRIPMIWDRLQHLTISCATGIPATNLIVLLGRCPQLISIRVSPILDSDVDPMISTSFLPFLDTFDTSSSSFNMAPRSLSYIVAYTSMPRLRRFSLRVATCQDEPHDSFSLATLGQKSRFIEDITICLPYFTKHSLPETLRSLPSLTKLLVFDGYTWEENGFQSCTFSQLLDILSDTATCPMLQELVIRNWDSPNSKSGLNAFITKRMESPHPLQRLEISGTPWASEVLDLIPETEIKFCLSRGLAISLLCDKSWKASPWTGVPIDTE
ncbi:hypothetical protein MSAN_00748400 [Mycena sanguinolenta]|uniref:F-box domain-containing protein n=1 Tax=Mycena sanguinolenta TaxID=230812 RepID=A0A8H6Z6B2_9AGAR|nr:hypothetical protein MSAN_00748400 [Mycena sanguinolenta]